MAVEIFATDNQEEVCISVPEFQRILHAFGGRLMIQLIHRDLCQLIEIWDMLINSATHVRFLVSNEVAQQLMDACQSHGIEAIRYCGDGKTPTQSYPRI